MPEDIISAPAETVQVANPESNVSPEVAQMMEMSLSIGKPTANPYQQPTQVDIPPTTINNDGSEQPEGQETSTTTVPDIFQPFKDKFGYQSAEDAIKEIEELRALKAAPQTPQELQFENEESKKFFNAALKGDRKAIYDILSKQEKLESLTTLEVSKDTAPEIIKMGMQLKNPDLSSTEIDFLFKQEYTLPKEPKEPIQRASESDDEYQERKEDYDERLADWKERVSNIEMKAIVAAKMAKPELDTAKSKLVFPEFQNDTDEEYIQYRKELEDAPKVQAEIVSQYKAITPKQIETKIKFTDEPSGINFEFQYEPDNDSFSQTVELVSDGAKLQKKFQNQDGTPDRKGFLEALHFGLNKERIILEAIKQSKNATIKASLPDNNNGGLQRQFPQRQELSEVDKLMQYSLSVK